MPRITVAPFKLETEQVVTRRENRERNRPSHESRPCIILLMNNRARVHAGSSGPLAGSGFVPRWHIATIHRPPTPLRRRTR